MSESQNDRMERDARKPPIHLKFDVETEGAHGAPVLPFVVGVLGEFSGAPDDPALDPPLRKKSLKQLKDREFTQISRDNFDKVMSGMQPRLRFHVENTLENDGSEFEVRLAFNSMADFGPERIAAQVPALAALLETRARLRDLLAKADGSDELQSILEDVLKTTSEGQGAPSASGSNDNVDQGETQ